MFCQGFSATTDLLNITDDSFHDGDDGMLTLLVPFDTLSYALMVAILCSCGFTNETLQLVKSFLIVH